MPQPTDNDPLKSINEPPGSNVLPSDPAVPPDTTDTLPPPPEPKSPS